MPICSEDIYPNESWKSNDLVLTAHSKQSWHRHGISDFAPWIPRSMMEVMTWARDKYSVADEETAKVLVELKDTDGVEISWDIIETLNSSASVDVIHKSYH